MMPDVCNMVIDYIRSSIMPLHRITVCAETVDVIRVSAFHGTNQPVSES
jgi:hypothetical protein